MQNLGSRRKIKRSQPSAALTDIDLFGITLIANQSPAQWHSVRSLASYLENRADRN